MSDLYGRVAASADRDFMIYGGSRTKTGEVLGRAQRVASKLRQYGVSSGDRIALILGNHPQWLISFVAITALGAVAVAIHDQAPTAQILAALESAQCSLAITSTVIGARLQNGRPRCPLLTAIAVGDDLFVDESEAAWQSSGAMHPYKELLQTSILPDQPALIAFTSGSAGVPKGAILSHRSMMTGLMNMMLGGALNSLQERGRKPAPRTSPPVALGLAPFSYIAGYANLLLMWYLGGRVIALPDPSTQAALALIRDEEVTSLVGVTTPLLTELLASNTISALQSLRSINVHGGVMHANLRKEIMARLPSVAMGTGYGMTETNGSVCMASGSILESRPGTCGQPLPTVELRLSGDDGVDVPRGEIGEISIRGAMNMLGYCNASDAPGVGLTNGWLRTGDLGRLDAEAYLEVVERLSNASVYEGTRISHSEIEKAILDTGLVRQAVMLGIENLRDGPRLVLVTVCDHESLERTAAIEQRLRSMDLAGLQPRVICVASLPHTPSGKLDSRELRREILRMGA